jgi:hypothetical protein
MRCIPVRYTYGMHAYNMHAREMYARKYMLIGCTPEITALIFVLYRE